MNSFPDTLQLVEPFLTSHNPEDFAASNSFHSQGQSIQWLERLVPVLSSQREEACSLAAFHFWYAHFTHRYHGALFFSLTKYCVWKILAWKLASRSGKD